MFLCPGFCYLGALIKFKLFSQGSYPAFHTSGFIPWASFVVPVVAKKIACFVLRKRTNDVEMKALCTFSLSSIKRKTYGGVLSAVASRRVKDEGEDK